MPNGSTTNTTSAINNTASVVGANVTWSTNTVCRYNTVYNIYIYWNKF